MFTLINVLILSLFMFSTGIAVVLSRKNVFGIFIGTQLMLHATAINFVAFSRFITHNLDGHAFALSIIVVAAVEAGVYLAIVLRMYQEQKTIDVTEMQELKG